MFFDVEWSEKGQDRFRKVFHAADLPVLWKAVKYMNMERRENGLPVIKQIQIKVMNKYDGEFSDIIGNYDADIMLDEDRSRS